LVPAVHEGGGKDKPGRLTLIGNDQVLDLDQFRLNQPELIKVSTI
jgi:hypothetical protein